MNEKTGGKTQADSPAVSWPIPGSVDQPDYQAGERDALIAEIKALLKKKDAVLVAHAYASWAKRPRYSIPRSGY